MVYPERFAGKVAVISGGTSGIGREIVNQFVREGGKIVIGARHDTYFERTQARDAGYEKMYVNRFNSEGKRVQVGMSIRTYVK